MPDSWIQPLADGIWFTYRSSTLQPASVGTASASGEYFQHAALRYRNGVVGYIDVLDAQRQLFDAQLILIEALRDQHLAVTLLYRALGGGWEASAGS